MIPASIRNQGPLLDVDCVDPWGHLQCPLLPILGRSPVSGEGRSAVHSGRRRRRGKQASLGLRTRVPTEPHPSLRVRGVARPAQVRAALIDAFAGAVLRAIPTLKDALVPGASVMRRFTRARPHARPFRASRPFPGTYASRVRGGCRRGRKCGPRNVATLRPIDGALPGLSAVATVRPHFTAGSEAVAIPTARLSSNSTRSRTCSAPCRRAERAAWA